MVGSGLLRSALEIVSGASEGGSLCEDGLRGLAASNPSFNLTALMPAPLLGSACAMWHRAAG